MTRMIDRACLLALCSFISLAGCGSDNKPAVDAPPADPTLVTTANGPVTGSVVGTSRQYLGIPYAQPPIGSLRWHAPQKLPPWTEPFTATAFGKRCAQVASPLLQNAASSDEDCLYLNVWTPSPKPAAALPVMVFIHGGGNVNGSASEPVPFTNGAGFFYSGQFLAQGNGVIVVTFNYRLGIFGFLPLPGLAAESSEGNQGLLDQVAALQWVHDNISAFGGDPGNVTIFGESAGSLDVCYHVASPLSRGLFHKAISESGGCTTIQPTKAQGETAATTLANNLSCTGATPADVLTCMRGKTVAQLLVPTSGFGPVVDGAFLTDQPRALYDAGNVAKVPYLLGSNNDEGTLFIEGVTFTDDTAYKTKLETQFTMALGDTLFNGLYAPANFPNGMPNADVASYARVVGDSQLVCTTLDSAERMAKTGAAVFMYNFDIPVPTAILPPGLILGASHGSELTSVFGTSTLFAMDAQAKAASDLIQRYWTNFARTGNPNGGSDPNWPQLTTTTNVRIDLSFTPTTLSNFRVPECTLWNSVYASRFPAN